MSEKESPPKKPVLPRQNMSTGSADVIGCCGLYLKCSDAKQCLHPDSPVSENCLYRKNLEAGRIFYGKNAFDFSPDAYQELERTVSALTAKEVETFLFITQTFRFMLATQLCVYDSPELHVIVDRFPYSLQDSAPYILKYFRYDALVNAVPVENGQRIRCEEAVSVARTFFQQNIPAVHLTKRNVFLTGCRRKPPKPSMRSFSGIGLYSLTRYPAPVSLHIWPTITHSCTMTIRR